MGEGSFRDGRADGMTGLARPRRVVVWGNGVAPDATVPRRADARVAVVPRPAHHAHELIARYEADLRAQSPDVAVLMLGALEARGPRHRVRAAWRNASGATPRRLVAALWRLVVGTLGSVLQGTRPSSTRRFDHAVRHLVHLLRVDLGADVVLVPPAAGPRAPQVTALLDAVASGEDPHVTRWPGTDADPPSAIVDQLLGVPSDGHTTSPDDDASVVVLGNSVAVLMVPQRQVRHDGTYGELLVDRLADAGRRATLALEGRWFDFAHRGLRQFDDRVGRHAPDVAVLHYGTNEAQPWLVPLPLLRHLLRDDAATSPLGRWYRRRPAALAWRQLRTMRTWASPRVGQRTWQRRPDRFARDMDRLVRRLRDEHDALVLVLDLTEPGAVLERFLPGQVERHRRVRRELEGVVARAADPDVRLVRVSDVVGELGADVALRDGMHLAPEVHARVAELLAAEAVPWLDVRRPRRS